MLLDATRAVKLLRRGDLWRAKYQCDGAMKQHLLVMLEWHARANHGPQHDIWPEGRYLSEWADPRAVTALPNTFASYNTDDLWRALWATLDLFHTMALETAQLLGYAYPALTDEHVIEWLRSTSPQRL